MRFSHFCIDRPVFATVMSILIVLLGAAAYFTLPVAQYPEIAPPTIDIRASYPGASAEVISNTVATPIEQEVNGVEDMLYMTSQATSDGQLQITVTFALGTDLNTAQVLVQNRVAVAESRLPEDVRRIGVTVRKSSPDILMVIHLMSPDGSRDPLYISNYATLQVRDALARLDGVGDVRIFGARDYAMRIWLDPEKVASRNLTAPDVIAALRAQNVQVASGVVNQPPVPEQGAFQMNVETLGRLSDPRQFRNIVVKTDADGRVTRLDDIAPVELAAQDYTANGYLDEIPAVPLLVFQRPGSNALATSDRLLATMEELSKDFPPGVKYDVIYNPTEFIAESVAEVETTIWIAIVLVVIVVVLFLQTWRAAVIPVVAIPISLIGTFMVMAALGYSLNTLSLFGLVLAIGIVVDDAIVVVENVERQLRAGFSPKEAAHRTMDEVGGALVAIALVLCAVFIPAALIGGIQGQFFRQFAVTIAAATVISLFVSLSLSPALCAILLKPHVNHDGQKGPVLFRPIRAFFNGFNNLFDRLSLGYGALTRRVLRIVVRDARRLRRADRADRVAVLPRSDRLHPGSGPGIPDHRHPAAARRLAGAHRRRGEAGDQDHPRDGGRRPRRAVLRLRRRDLHQRLERRRDLFALRGFPRARGEGTFLAAHPGRAEPEALVDPGCLHIHHPAAARPRHRHRRRVQDDGRGPQRPRPAGARGGGAGDRRESESNARACRRLLALQHAHAKNLRRYRPRPGGDDRRAGGARVRHARGLSRLDLRERLQPARPHFSRDRAG